MITIRESHDYEGLSVMFHENGLEIKPGIQRPEHVVNCWECIDSETGQLIGGASLEKRAGEFVVADVAVNQEFRGRQIGVQLMHILEEEILRLGGKQAWLVGKVPGFYKKLGWEVVTREEAPDISKCFTCDQFGTTCNPEIMKKTFQ